MPRTEKFFDTDQVGIDVSLVSMPFGPLFTPSIALGLLSSELSLARFCVKTYYFTIPFSKKTGFRLYERISAGFPEGTLLIGDWLFRDALFGAAGKAADDAYMELLSNTMAKQPTPKETAGSIWCSFNEMVADLTKIRRHVEPFLDECAQALLLNKPAIVGFTTVYQQNVASLALSKRLKILRPDLHIVFGGANCESVMGSQILKTFSYVDHVVSGEGEKAIVALASEILGGARGTKSLRDTAIRTGPAPVELDSLSYPEFDSYFEQVRDLPEVERRARLLFETSRGCWWGERSHCTFCGLNGTNMAFRSKSAGRAYNELKWLTSRYSAYPVSVVDNILDLKYFDDFIPMLTKKPLGSELFYEVKANLTKQQLMQMSRAGITLIQPGIESLHDGVLRLMKKGVSAIQNIQLLKWSAELGVKPLWNMIWGFPGEKPEWYAEMQRLVPFIAHLQPPGDGSAIRLDRFSPLFNEPSLGASKVRPFASYRSVYAELTDAERFNLAYYFEFDRVDNVNEEEYTSDLNRLIVRWNETHDLCAYFYMRIESRILLFDLRDPNSVDFRWLTPLETRLYDVCDGAKTIGAVLRELADPSISSEVCAECLAGLASEGTMVEINGKYLSLAVPMNQHVPSVVALQRFQAFLAENNRSVDDAASEVPLSKKSTGVMA